MSEIKVNSIKGVGASAAAITVNNSDGTCTANITNNLSNRNKIINGGMVCSQRGSSFAAANNMYTLDRFKIQGSHDGAVTISQSTTSPDGFSKSFKVDVTTADTSIASGQYIQINTRPEAQDLQDLAYGTSAAKTITVSFYVRSNVTGTYTFAIQQADNSSKQVSQTYTINSADTWERKTFTFAGDTSGVINDDNGTGFQINWNLAIGSQYTSGTSRSVWTAYADGDFAAGHTANILSSTSNEFYITGVQLEIGSVATDFEHRSFAQELLLCRRYAVVWKSKNKVRDYIIPAKVEDSDDANTAYETSVQMRSTPSIVISSADHIKLNYTGGNQNGPVNFSTRTYDDQYENRLFINMDLNSAVLTSGDMVFLAFTNSTATGTGTFTLDAEL